jgi:hypothetical protein
MSHHNLIFGPQQTIYSDPDPLEVPFTLSSSFEDEYEVEEIPTEANQAYKRVEALFKDITVEDTKQKDWPLKLDAIKKEAYQGDDFIPTFYEQVKPILQPKIEALKKEIEANTDLTNPEEVSKANKKFNEGINSLYNEAGQKSKSLDTRFKTYNDAIINQLEKLSDQDYAQQVKQAEANREAMADTMVETLPFIGSLPFSNNFKKSLLQTMQTAEQSIDYMQVKNAAQRLGRANELIDKINNREETVMKQAEEEGWSDKVIEQQKNLFQTRQGRDLGTKEEALAYADNLKKEAKADIIFNLAEGQEYQDTIDLLGKGPELFDENGNLDFQFSDFQKGMGSQVFQVAQAMMSGGVGTYIQEAGGMTKEVLDIAAKEYIPNFDKLPVDEQNERLADLIDQNLVDFDKIGPAAFGVAGLDLLGNFFVLGKGLKVMPRSIGRNILKGRTKAALQNAKEKAVDWRTYFNPASKLAVESGTEALQEGMNMGATTAALKEISGGNINTFDSKRIKEAAGLALITTGPITTVANTTRNTAKNLYREGSALFNENTIREFSNNKKAELEQQYRDGSLSEQEVSDQLDEIDVAEDIAYNRRYRKFEPEAKKEMFDIEVEKAGLNRKNQLLEESTAVDLNQIVPNVFTESQKKLNEEKLKELNQKEGGIIFKQQYLVNDKNFGAFVNANPELFNGFKYIGFKTRQELEDYAKKNNIAIEGNVKEAIDGNAFGVAVPSKKIFLSVKENINAVIDEGVSPDNLANAIFASNVVHHEGLHALQSTMTDSQLTDLRAALVNAPQNNSKVSQIIQAADEIVNNLPGVKEKSRESNEEFFAKISDLLRGEDLTEQNVSIDDASMLSTIGTEILKLLGNRGQGAVDFSNIENGSEVIQFLKRYNKFNGKPIAELKLPKLKPAGTQIPEDEEITQVKDAASTTVKQKLFQAIQSLVPKDINTKKDYQKFLSNPRQFNPLYNSITQQDGAINNYIKGVATSPEEFQLMVENVQDRVLAFDPEAERKDGSAVGIDAFVERIMSDAKFGKLDARKKLFEEGEKQKSKTAIDAPEATQIADEPANVVQVKNVLKDLGLQDLINEIDNTSERAIINAENKLKGTEKLSPKKRVTIRNKAFNDIIKNRIDKDIKNTFGKNTATSKSFTDFLNNNFETLKNIALKNINFKKGVGATLDWNQNPPSKQEFIDYYIADGENASTKSDRKLKLQNAVIQEISEQARKNVDPVVAKEFKQKTQLPLASKKIPVKKFYNEATQLAQIGINQGVDSNAFKNFKTSKVIKDYVTKGITDNIIKRGQSSRYGGVIYEDSLINFLQSLGVNTRQKGAAYNKSLPDIVVYKEGKAIIIEAKLDDKVDFGQISVKLNKEGEFVIPEDFIGGKELKFYLNSLKESGIEKQILDAVNKSEGLKGDDIITTIPFGRPIKKSTGKKINNIFNKSLKKSLLFSPSVVIDHYLKKVPKGTPVYIQIGGKGLYHIGSDLLGLGTPAFDFSVTGNFRFKQGGKQKGKPDDGKRNYSFSAAFKLLKPKSVPNSPINIENEKDAKAFASAKITSLSDQFNKILEGVKGVKAEARYSDARAAKLGAKRNPYKFFVPYSAEDYVGLIYPTLGKDEAGNNNLEWYQNNILNPYARGIRDFENAKQASLNTWANLKSKIKNTPAKLNKEAVRDFTNEEAIRLYLWNKQDMLPEGVAKKDIDAINKHVNDNENLLEFANQIQTLTPDGYPAPSGSWLAGTITTDLVDYTNTVKRGDYLKEWQANVDEVYSKDNMNKLRALYGDNYVEALENMLYRMKTGRNRPTGGNKLTNQYLNWVNNSVGGIMFFNTRSALLQTISAINYLNFTDNNPLRVAQAFANQPQFWKDFSTIFNSNFLKSRRSGLKTDVNADEIARTAATAENKFRAGLSYLLKKGFIPTQYADSFAISFGGATFYRNRIKSLIKSGMDQKQAEEQAFLDLKEITEESQQSSRPDRVSMQQASPLGRIILAFANTPMQYTRLTKKAALDLINGRGDWKTNVSKLVYYGAVQNIIFTALQNAMFAMLFSDEEEKDTKKRYTRMANNGFDTLLRGSGVHGAAVAMAKNIVLEAIRQSEGRQDFEKAALQITTLSPPIDSKLKKLMAAGRAFKYKQEREKMSELPLYDIDNPALMSAGRVLSVAFNIPLDRALQKAQNLRLSVDSDTEMWQSIALALGYNKWDLNMDDPKNPKFVPQRIKPGSDFKLEDTDFKFELDEDPSRIKGTPTKKIENLPNGVLGKAHKDGTIQIRKGLSAKKKAEVLKHEKQHVKDMNSGRLNYDQSYVYWEGKKYPRVSGQKIVFNGKALPEGHGSFPWERAANKAV